VGAADHGACWKGSSPLAIEGLEVELALKADLVVGQAGVAHHRLHAGAAGRAVALGRKLEADQQAVFRRLAAKLIAQTFNQIARAQPLRSPQPGWQSGQQLGAPRCPAGSPELARDQRSLNDTIAGRPLNHPDRAAAFQRESSPAPASGVGAWLCRQDKQSGKARSGSSRGSIAP